MLPRTEVSAKTLSYKFDFMELEDGVREKFMNGTYQCAVQAVRRVSIDREGKKIEKILQRSPVKTQNFNVDIGDPKKARGKKGAKNPYGL